MAKLLVWCGRRAPFASASAPSRAPSSLATFASTATRTRHAASLRLLRTLIGAYNQAYRTPGGQR